MAKTESDGKGTSKTIQTAAEQNATRRARKASQRRNHSKGGSPNAPRTTNLFQEINEDRVAQRAQASEDTREQRRTATTQAAYESSLQHLRSYGERQIPDGKGGQRPRWSGPITTEAADLLHLYFFAADQREVDNFEANTMLSEKIINEVRKRFVTGLLFAKGDKLESIGEAQEWYNEVHTSVSAFHAQRRADNRAARAAAQSTPATA